MDWGIDLKIFKNDPPEFTTKSESYQKLPKNSQKLPKMAGNCQKRPEIAKIQSDMAEKNYLGSLLCTGLCTYSVCYV